LPFLSDGEFLHAGEFQYFRIPVDLWEKNIPRLKDLKLNTISTYIPWNWHEIKENFYDFDGSTHPSRNLKLFLELVKKNGFKLIVRPGPYIYAEYLDYGIPRWFKEKYPEALILTEKGKRLDNVSYGHPKLLQYTKKWYRTLFKILKPYIDSGMIIAFQLDNETGLFQAGDVLEKIDYNDHIVSAYKQWLKKKFERIERVNLLFKEVYSNFDEITPPRGNITFSHGSKWVTWLQFYQDYLVQYLEELKKIAQDVGFNVPIVHNDSIILLHPVSTKKKFRLANVGLDIYVKTFEEFDTPFDYPFSSVFDSKYISYYAKKNGYRPWGAEIQSGWLNPYTKVPLDQTWMLALSLIAHGLTGISWYIIHDGIEQDGTPYEYNSAFDKDGNPTQRFEVHQKIANFIESFKTDLLKSHELFDDIAAGHLELSNMKHLMFIGDILIESMPHKSFMGAVSDNQWNYGFLDLEDEPIKSLKQNKVIVFHSLGFAPLNVVEKLETYVAEGGRLITFPMPILWDEYLQPQSSEIYPYDLGKIEWPSLRLFLLRFYLWTMMWKYFVKKKYPHKWSESTLFANYIASKIVRFGYKYRRRFFLEKIPVTGFLKHVQFKLLQKTPSAKPIMHRYNVPYGFSVKYGDGYSITLGSELFMDYNFPYYYSMSNTVLNNVRNALNVLFANAPHMVTANPPNALEVVLRQKDDEFLLFVFNRGPEKEVELTFHINSLKSEEYKVVDVVSMKTISHASNVKNGKMALKISENDAVLFLLSR